MYFSTDSSALRAKILQLEYNVPKPIFSHLQHLTSIFHIYIYGIADRKESKETENRGYGPAQTFSQQLHQLTCADVATPFQKNQKVKIIHTVSNYN
jgi:hypothetical protein